MRKMITVLLVALPFWSGAQTWKTFTDTAGMFTAKYPAGWVNKIKENNRVFFTSPADGEQDNFFENINISVTKKAGYGTQVTIKDLYPGIVDGVRKQFTEFRDEGVRYFKWNNIDAVEVIYSGLNKMDESLRIRTTQWYCFYKSRLYLATFVSEAANSSHNETARKIMNGIVFK